jgi:hypothetical protein
LLEKIQKAGLNGEIVFIKRDARLLNNRIAE